MVDLLFGIVGYILVDLFFVYLLKPILLPVVWIVVIPVLLVKSFFGPRGYSGNFKEDFSRVTHFWMEVRRDREGENSVK